MRHSVLRRARPVAAYVLVGVLNAAVVAPTSPACAAEQAPELTFESLRVQASDLPANVKEVPGLYTAARQARAFFMTPRPIDLGPQDLPDALKDLLRGLGEPTRKAGQSFRADGGRPGSLLWFEYADGVPEHFEGWMKSYLYGAGSSPSERYPEFLAVTDKFVIIASFRRGDPGGEWVKSHLRRFGIPAQRWSQERARLARDVVAAMDAGRPGDGLAALDGKPDLEADSASLRFLRGELGAMKSDHVIAEKGYRGALELHRSRVSPLSPRLRWASLDGLGIALLYQRKLTAATKALEEAVALGRENAFEGWPAGLYNLACAASLQRRFKACHEALAAAIEEDPRFKETARTDPDLAAARKRPDVRKLIE